MRERLLKLLEKGLVRSTLTSPVSSVRNSWTSEKSSPLPSPYESILMEEITESPMLDAPPPLIPKSIEAVSLFTVEPLEIARQLTIIDFHLFVKIPVQEFVGKSMPCVSNLIQRFNHVTQWVISEILFCKNVKERSKVIKQFIKIAEVILFSYNRNVLNYRISIAWVLL